MAVTGLTLSRFGDGIRVPVTTISETSPSASWAAACVAELVAGRGRALTNNELAELVGRIHMEPQLQTLN